MPEVLWQPHCRADPFLLAPLSATPHWTGTHFNACRHSAFVIRVLAWCPGAQSAHAIQQEMKHGHLGLALPCPKPHLAQAAYLQLSLWKHLRTALQVSIEGQPCTAPHACNAARLMPLAHLLRRMQGMMGSLVKRVSSRQLGVEPQDIFHCTIMPCYDRKLEAAREELRLPGRIFPFYLVVCCCTEVESSGIQLDWTGVEWSEKDFLIFLHDEAKTCSGGYMQGAAPARSPFSPSHPSSAVPYSLMTAKGRWPLSCGNFTQKGVACCFVQMLDRMEQYLI